MTRTLICLASLGLLACLAGCGGRTASALHATTPVTAPAVPQSAAGQTVFPVTMRPQPVIAPGFAHKGVAWTTIPAAPGDGSRRASYNLLDLRQRAADFDITVEHNRIAASGSDAILTPDWQDENSDPEGLAYGTYMFQLDDYASSGGAQTVGLEWDSADPPADFGNLWVGLANWDQQQWDWYAGPEDGVLTLDSLTPYTDTGGRARVMVLLTGSAPATLQLLRVGDTELRGTGALDELPSNDPVPPLASGGGLLSSVDLRPGCSAINDQGTADSSTAFAVGDGAYNYELARIYGAYGWNLADPFNRISPKYLYGTSGADQGFGCPDAGRYTSGVATLLTLGGASTELNAPYSNVCDDNWSADALTDAGYLRSAGAQTILCGSADCVETLKVVLSRLHRPLVLRVNLDHDFFGYAAGQTWNFAGPTVAGQAMCIVGYDDARQAFLARNSWSADWGDGGYMWLGYATLSNPAAGARCWYLWDEYDKAVAQRFCSGFANLEPPKGVAASDGTFDDKIHLAWLPSPGATGYYIYRDRDDNLVQTLNSGAADAWDDTDTGDLLTHVYWVRAFSATDQSELSAPDLGYRAAPLQLIAMTIDKTTHLQDGSETPATLVITVDPPAASYVWAGPGVFTGTGTTVTWQPDPATPLGKSQLTCTAYRGSFMVEGTTDVYVTDQPIQTQCGAEGRYVDFADRPSVQQPDAPYRPLSYYADGHHAVMFFLWGAWCAPARAQMPLINQWATAYEGKLYCVGMNDFNGDTLASAVAYYNTNGYAKLESYSPWDANVWATYGEQGYIPNNVLIDQDGYIRRQEIGALSGAMATAWETTIQQLTGLP